MLTSDGYTINFIYCIDKTKRSAYTAKTPWSAIPRRSGPSPARRVPVDTANPAAYRPWRRLVAVDPGQVNIVTCTEVLANGLERVWRLSRAEWRALVSADRRIVRARKWTAGLSSRPEPNAPLSAANGAFVRLSDPSVWPKTSNVAQYVQHMKLKAEVEPAIFAETLKSRWADEEFRAKRAKAQVLHAFWSRVCRGILEDGTAGVTPMVAYGDANLATSIGGRLSAPTTAAYVACCHAMGPANVVLTTEHRSSKCCSACGHVLRKVLSPNASRRAQRKHDYKIGLEERRSAEQGDAYVEPAWARFTTPNWAPLRRLFACNNSSCQDSHASFVDRDLNATRNIRRAFETADRFKCMTSDEQAAPGARKLPDHMVKTSHKDDDAEQTVAPFIVPVDTLNRVPHGDGGTKKPRARAAAREALRKRWGTDAPMAGPPGDPHMLLPGAPGPVAEVGGAWRSFAWPARRRRGREMDARRAAGGGGRARGGGGGGGSGASRSDAGGVVTRSG
jgi:hypothetical protein